MTRKCDPNLEKKIVNGGPNRIELLALLAMHIL